MSNVLNIILQNPFRILGVYANSPKKDIVANKGKAAAFLKVNRPVEFPLDLKGILPLPVRSLDTMNEAEAHLTIAKEQIKYAQFWWLKVTPLDEMALRYLGIGRIDSAFMIWSKPNNLSALQNRMICTFIKGDIQSSISIAENLYEQFGDSYINKVAPNCTLQMSGAELFHQYLDTLGEEIGMQALLRYELGKETKSYISSQTVGPLINRISTEVEKAKRVNHKDPILRKETGQSLINTTKELLPQLKSILSTLDPQYQTIADKVGLEILQCGIDYFNNSNDDEAPHIAMKMQKYAQSVVVGDLAIQRCNENVNILHKIIEQLPPREIILEDRAIKAELSKFVRLPDKISHAVTLLFNTKPHLQIIKNKLGATNDYYLKLSTQIVGNAMHNVVEEVNAIHSDPQIAVRLQLGLGLDPTSMSRIKDVYCQAWKAIAIMDGFDLELDYRSRYDRNRNTLKSMCNKMGISTDVSKPTLGYNGSLNDSSTSSRPNRNFVIAIVVALFFLLIIGCLIYYSKKEKERMYQERQELIYTKFRELRLKNNVDLCVDFLSEFPDCDDTFKKSVQTLFANALMKKADSLIDDYNGDISLLQNFIDTYSYFHGFSTENAINKIKNEIDIAIEKQREIEQKRKEQEEFARYGTDSNAWETATSINTIDSYREYLERYPHGKHKDKANKKIIDLEVQTIINKGDYGYLPSSQKVSSGIGESSSVKIRSRCNITITIMYSGKNSVKVEIPPKSSRNIVLPSGNYKVVATAPGVRPFYGDENLTGGIYESEYYIETRRY